MSENKYYKCDLIVDNPTEEDYGKKWATSYIKLYGARPAKDGKEFLLGKYFRQPNYEDVDITEFIYCDAVVSESLDEYTPITEEEYNQALEKFLSDIRKGALDNGFTF